MTQEGFKRKLSAILSADVKGYSLLMADDETFTIKTLKEFRQVMSNLIVQYSGRVVDSPGDNILAEFSSAVNAVECAVDIQKSLKKENDRFVEDKRLQFRIGVNIGDIVQEGGRIYGSGVNIAARIEALTDSGGICISRNTYDQVKDKLEVRFEYLGEFEAKNIKEPVRVYKVLMDRDLPNPLVDEQLEVPDKPSIAVLPFVNMSGDPGQEYFSDGLTEQIINGLCKVKDLFVIARNSSFAYRGRSVSIKQIARELGVKYILEGSVQRAGNRVRITAQLIDASTDYHMWSESYDRDFNDIFTLQDEITMKLISVMEVKLIFGEQARLWEGITTKNIYAYEKCMQGLKLYNQYTRQDNYQSRKFAEEAIAIDNDYPFAYVLLGLCHWVDLHANWSESPVISFQLMEQSAKKALALAESFDMAYVLMELIHLIQRNHEKAIECGEKALSLNPNGAAAFSALAYVLAYAGKSAEAISLGKKAIRLNPIPHAGNYIALAMSYQMNGQYKEAIKICWKILSENPDNARGHIILAISYSLLGQYDKANELANEVIHIWPNYSIDLCTVLSPFKRKSDLDIVIDALRKAGIPEHSLV